MNAELLYTSAPQGLKQGSRGFCTVLSTVGMPLNIATKLESLSGYRHLYPSGTPDAAKNPVNHSHLRLSVGGRTLSILSRISDYGLDYSQRTNKLAHHIVVDTPMPPCGPAALLADPSIMRSEWDGTCANIPTPPAFPALSVEPSPCTLWESITGDAGWAGVVASAWMNTTSKPTFIVFSEDQSDQLLKLLEEAISLLPPSKRWQATFGTYVTNLPPDVDCKVRCVVAGSDEARMASARGVVINLTQPLDHPPPSESVSAARDGNYIGGRPNSPPLIATSGIEEPPGNAPEEESVEQLEELKFDPEQPFARTSTNQPPSLGTVIKRHVPAPNNIDAKKRVGHKNVIVSLSLAGVATVAIAIAIFSKMISEYATVVESNTVASSNQRKESAQKQSTESGNANREPSNNPRLETHSNNDLGSGVQSTPAPVPSPPPKDPPIPPPTKPKQLLSFAKLSISLDNLSLKVKSVAESELKIPLGLIGSSSQAEIIYNTNDESEKNIFNEWISGSESIKWIWQQSTDGGTSWTPRHDLNSPAIAIGSTDKPNTLFKVEAEVDNKSMFVDSQPKHKVTSNNTLRTEDYIEIEINSRELANRAKNLKVEPKFKEFLKGKQVKSEFDIDLILPERKTRLKELPLHVFRSSMVDSGCINTCFDKWDESLESLKKVNSLRDKMKEALTESKSAHEQELINAKVTYNASDPNISWIFTRWLSALREPGSNAIDTLSYFNSWDTRELLIWKNHVSDLSRKNAAVDNDPKAGRIISPDSLQFLIFRKDWFGYDEKSHKELQGTHAKTFEELVDSNSQFQTLRMQLLNSQFFLDKPLSGAGLFSIKRGSGASPESSIPVFDKALIELTLWYRIKITGPTDQLINPMLTPNANAPVIPMPFNIESQKIRN
jgi:hypothetical protein